MRLLKTQMTRSMGTFEEISLNASNSKIIHLYDYSNDMF